MWSSNTVDISRTYLYFNFFYSMNLYFISFRSHSRIYYIFWNSNTGSPRWCTRNVWCTFQNGNYGFAVTFYENVDLNSTMAKVIQEYVLPQV